MNSTAVLLKLTRYELVLTSRNARVVVFSLVFPVILLVLFNSVFASGGDQTTEVAGEKISADAYFTAAMLAYAIVMASFSTLAITLTTRRETGQLKRMRGTPMPAWSFIAAILLRTLAVVALMSVVLLGVGHFAFDVPMPAEALAGIAVYVVLGTFALAALGVAVTAFLPSAEAASTVAPFSIVMLSFISGVFIPVETLPNWLEEIGRIFPLAHLAEGLQLTLADPSGTGLNGDNVAVLAAWGLAGLFIAVRRFRWEPSRASG